MPDDFTTMYDNLEQNEIITSVGEAVDLVFQHKAIDFGCSSTELKVSPKNLRMSKRRAFSFFDPRASTTSTNVTMYDITKVKELLSFCVTNTYVLQGGSLFKQKKGIPMGANASPDLANIFCHMKERAFMLNLLSTGQTRLAKKLSSTKRYIDDMLCFGTPPPPTSNLQNGVSPNKLQNR